MCVKKTFMFECFLVSSFGSIKIALYHVVSTECEMKAKVVLDVAELYRHTHGAEKQ